MEDRFAAEGVQVGGKFNVKLFFETLALILSKREKVKITVKVTSPQEIAEQEAANEP